MSVTIKKVESGRDFKVFARFANKLYKGNKYYVPALVFDELGTFDKNKNGEAADYYLGNYSTHMTFSASMLSYAGGAGNNVGHLVTLVDKNAVPAAEKVKQEKIKQRGGRCFISIIDNVNIVVLILHNHQLL